MEILSAVIPLIIIILLFFAIVRIATVILKLTGLDQKTALFQAISSFTGTGFTTKEAEAILEHDLRRRTVIVLMVLGRVGVISVIAGLFVSFGQNELTSDLSNAAILIFFIAGLYKLAASKGFSRALNRFIEKRIIAGGIVKQQTLEELFRLPKGYGIAQLTIAYDSAEKGKTLADAGFINKNILVLSIERENKLIPFPRADDIIERNDRLLCYGHLDSIQGYA